MRLLTWLGDWLDRCLDMHLSFDGDLMTPDWSVGDGDPVLRPEHKPVRPIVKSGTVTVKA